MGRQVPLRFILRFILLLSFFLSISSLNAAFTNCTSLWSLGLPDRDHRYQEFPCFQYQDLEHQNLDPIKLYWSQELKNTPHLQHRMKVMSKALHYAYSRYSILGKLPTISLIYHHRPYFSDQESEVTQAFAFINFYHQNESCPIFLYPISETLSDDYLKQLMAHELFHCFQKENFPHLVLNAIQYNLGQWWFEGLAQFMSNWVFPEINFEYSPLFSTYDPQLPLTEQISPYQSFALFQDYYNRLGKDPRQIIELMNCLPTTKYPKSQEGQVLLQLPRMIEFIPLFFQNYSDGFLLDSSQQKAPIDPIPREVLELTGLPFQVLTFRIRPLTLNLYQITIPAGEDFQFSLNLPKNSHLWFKESNESNKSNESKIEDEEALRPSFKQLPQHLSSDCFNDKKITLLLTSLSPSDHQDHPININLSILRNPHYTCMKLKDSLKLKLSNHI